jgi:hypothetical protein
MYIKHHDPWTAILASPSGEFKSGPHANQAFAIPNVELKPAQGNQIFSCASFKMMSCLADTILSNKKDDLKFPFWYDNGE